MLIHKSHVTVTNAAVDEGHVLTLSDEERGKHDRLIEIAELGLLAGLYAILRKQKRDVVGSPEDLTTIVADYTPALVRELRSGMERGWQLGLGIAAAYLNTTLNTRLLNQEGLHIAEAGSVALAQQLNARTINRVQAIVIDWVNRGKPAKELATLLEVVYGRHRAEAIAITEMTNYHARAALRGYQSSGEVVGMAFFTANDDRVCPICAPLGGLTFNEEAIPTSIERQERRAVRTSLYSTFVHPGGNGDAAQYAGLPFFPACHVRCRCRISPVVR